MSKAKQERQIEEYRLLMGEEKTQKQLDEAKRCWFCGVRKGEAHSPGERRLWCSG